MDSVVNEQLEKLKQRIDFEENIFGDYNTYEKVLNNLLEDSKYIALSLRFPYQDFSNKDIPNQYKNWQIRCSIEIYQNIGREGIKSYSENGLNWTRDSGYLTPELVGEIEPLIGYIPTPSKEA